MTLGELNCWRGCMINIAVCDDEAVFREVLEGYITQYMDREKCQFEIHSYSTGEELLKDIESYDVVFLDIQLGELSGIEIKEKMQVIQGMPYIIFVSSYTSCMGDSFGYNVIGFVEKPITKGQVESYLRRVQQLLGKEQKIQVNDLVMRTKNVYLIGSMGVYTKVCTMESTPLHGNVITAQQYIEQEGILIRKPMSYWEEQLQHSDFIKVHRKYMVNLRHVTAFHGEQMELNQNIVVPVSKRLKSQVKERYIQYCKELVGELCV